MERGGGRARGGGQNWPNDFAVRNCSVVMHAATFMAIAQPSRPCRRRHAAAATPAGRAALCRYCRAGGSCSRAADVLCHGDQPPIDLFSLPLLRRLAACVSSISLARCRNYTYLCRLKLHYSSASCSARLYAQKDGYIGNYR